MYNFVSLIFQASSSEEKTIRITVSNAEDDVEGLGVLEARVAQQSELISLLKQRADSTLLQVGYIYTRARVYIYYVSIIHISLY